MRTTGRTAPREATGPRFSPRQVSKSLVSSGVGKSTRTRAANADVAIPETSLAEFESCTSILVGMGMAEADADKAIRTAFGYGSQLYWRGEKVGATIDVSVVESALEYLEAELNLTADADKVECVKKYPELLTIDRELMAGNVLKLTDRFKMKGTVLANSIKRKPRVLGATTDCQGDCAGDCTRCFAQF